MNSTSFNPIHFFGTNNNSSSKEKNRSTLLSKIKKNKPEIIAWGLFFGVGVAYFVATLLIALY